MHPLIDADRYPLQSGYVGTRVTVCFNYDASRTFKGVCIRDDKESVQASDGTVIKAGTQLFLLEDGRVVDAVECMWSPVGPGRYDKAPGARVMASMYELTDTMLEFIEKGQA